MANSTLGIADLLLWVRVLSLAKLPKPGHVEVTRENSCPIWASQKSKDAEFLHTFQMAENFCISLGT